MTDREIESKFICDRSTYQKNILVKLKHFPFERSLDSYRITRVYLSWDDHDADCNPESQNKQRVLM